MKKIIVLLLSIVLALAFVGCSAFNKIKYESDSITAGFVGYGKGTKMEVLFSKEDVPEILSILNNSKWDKTLCKCGYEYIFHLDDNVLYYSYRQGIINDYENDRNLKLSDEDKAYLNSIIIESIEYKSSSIHIRQSNGDSAPLSEKLEDEDIQKILSILNSGTWDESLTNSTAEGYLQLDGFDLVYSSGGGIISDYLHGRSLKLSQQDKQYISELIYKLVERDNSWIWAIDETTGDRLVKYEYYKGTLIFKRYYALTKTYNDEYTFAGLEEVAYEKYYYDGDGGRVNKYEFYARGYGEEDYMPLALQYTGYFEYGYEDEFSDKKGRICYTQIGVSHWKTGSEDEYYYSSDGELVKIEKYDSRALSYTITYENGRPSGFIKDGKTSVPAYDEDGNMTALAIGETSLLVEYNEKMPTKITLERGGESVTAELVFDGKNRLESTRLTVGDTCYSAKYSYDIASFEEKVVGYKSEKGNDPVEVMWETKRYYSNRELAYNHFKTIDGEVNGKWVETVVEYETSYVNSLMTVLRFRRTSSEDKNGGTTGQIEFENKLLAKKEFLYDDGTKQSFEYHYDKNGHLHLIVDLVNGDKYDFDVDEYGNVLSYTAPGEYYEYVKNLGVVFYFDRTRFNYFDKEAYVTKKVVDGWGTLKCYYDYLTKTSEKFESSNRQIGYITDYYSNGSLKKYEYWEYMRKDGVISDKYRLLEQYSSKGRLYFRSVTDLYTVKKEYFKDIYAELVRDYTLIYDKDGTLQEKIEFKDGLESRHLYYDSDETVDYGKSQFYSYTFFGDGRIKYKKTSMSNETVLQEDHYKIEINNLGEESYYLCESKVYDFRGGYMLYEYKLLDNGKTYKSREMSYSFGNVIYDKYFDENGNEIN